MKFLSLIAFVGGFLSTSNACARNNNGHVYYYKERIIFYNVRLERNDTVYSYFKILKKGNNLYAVDSVINNVAQKNPQNKNVGKYIVKGKESFLSAADSSPANTPVYVVNGAANTYLNKSLYIFFSGNSHSDGDTFINKHQYRKFIRNQAGGPGSDIPRYESVEYVDLSNMMPFIMKIIYRHPWREVDIYESTVGFHNSW